MGRCTTPCLTRESTQVAAARVVTKRSRAHHDRSVRPVLRAVAPKIEGTTVALTDGGPPVGREELPMKWYVCVALLLVACSDNNDNDNDNHIVTRTDIVT